MVKKIGFIGLGVMGASMSSRLIDAGYELYIYNRTKNKGDALVEKGAHWCDTPRSVAEQAEIILTIVGYPKDVEEVYLGRNGIVEGISEGKICCDMTTTKPSLDIEIAEKLMVGCSDEVFRELLPIFSVMGKNITHMGSVGAGQNTKMTNQIVIAGTMCGVSEALVYGAKAGLNLEKMVATISKGAAGCWTLDNLAPRVLKGDYEPGFMVEHFIKDMGIALEEAEKMELSLPSLALTKQLYLAIKAEGHGRKGTQVLVKALEALSGKEIL